MKMEELAKVGGYKVPAAHHPFMRLGLEKLDLFHAEIADLEATLQDVVKLGGQDS